MIVKLNQVQFEFLRKTLYFERPDLSKHLPTSAESSFEIGDEIALEIRDWASEKLQKEGYDQNYNLNQKGKILERLEDIFYS